MVQIARNPILFFEKNCDKMILEKGWRHFMKKETKKMGERVKNYNQSRNFQIYAIMFIPLLIIFIFNYVPMFGLIMAFKNYRYDLGIFGSPWVGFGNFEFFFTSNDCWRVLRNTIGLNAIFIVCGVAFAVFVALFLYEVKSRTKTKIFQTIMITPNFLSWVVVSYMAYAFLNPAYGLLNTVFESIGIAGIDWYSTPGVWPVILTVCSVWKAFGMDSVVYYASLMGVDPSLEEAALIDGASRGQIRRYIYIPSIIPVITIMTILKIGGIMRADFGLFYQVTRDVGTLYPTTDVIDTYIFRALRQLGNVGMSTAIGMFQSVVGLVLVLITNFITEKISPDNALL